MKMFQMSAGEILMDYITVRFAVVVMSYMHFQSAVFQLTWEKYQNVLSPAIIGPKLIVESWASWAFPGDNVLIDLYHGTDSEVPWGEWIIPITLWTTLFAVWVVLFAVQGCVRCLWGSPL